MSNELQSRFNKEATSPATPTSPERVDQQVVGDAGRMSGLGRSLWRVLSIATVWLLQELRMTTIAMWNQVLRITAWLLAECRLLLAQRRERSAKVLLGEQLFAEGKGDESLRRELRQVVDRIADDKTSWLDRWRLSISKSRLCHNLASSAEAARESAIATTTDIRQLENDVSNSLGIANDRRHVLPKHSTELARVLIGSFAIVALLLLIALRPSWAPVSSQATKRGNKRDAGNYESKQLLRAESVALLNEATDLVVADSDVLKMDGITLLGEIGVLQIEFAPKATSHAVTQLLGLARQHHDDPTVKLQTSRSLRRIVEKMAEKGEFAGAEALMTELSLVDDRAIALALVGVHGFRHGDQQSAKKSIAEAVKLARDSNDLTKQYVAQSAIRSDLDSLANPLITSLQPTFRDALKMEVILMDLKLSRIDPLKATAIPLRYADHRDQVRLAAISRLCDDGRPEEALDLAHAMESPLRKSRAVAIVAYALSANGDADLALLSFFNAKLYTLELPQGYLRAQHLVTIGELERLAGDADGFLRTFDRAREIALAEKKHYWPPTCLVLSRVAMVRNSSDSDEVVADSQRLLAGSTANIEGYYDACRAVGAATLKVRGKTEAVNWQASDQRNLSRAAKLVGIAEALGGVQGRDLPSWAAWPSEAFSADELAEVNPKKYMVLDFEWGSIRPVVESVAKHVLHSQAQEVAIRGKNAVGVTGVFSVMEVGQGIAVIFEPSESGWRAFESFCDSPLFAYSAGVKIPSEARRYATHEKPMYTVVGRFKVSYSCLPNGSHVVTLTPTNPD